MPIYEYVCQKCGTKFERIVKNSEEKVKCEKCGDAKVERALSRFSAKVASAACPSEGSCPSAGSSRSCMHGGGCGCGHRH